jgi:hypothetical protein
MARHKDMTDEAKSPSQLAVITGGGPALEKQWPTDWPAMALL